MTRSRIRSVVLLVGVALAGGAGAFACTYDFHLFDPVPDGSLPDGANPTDGPVTGDGTVPLDDSGKPIEGGLDGGADAPDGSNPCSAAPPPECLDAGGNCSKTCTADRVTCVNGCLGIDTACKNACANTETTCKKGCFNTCVKCTGDAGCEDPPRCNLVVNPP
jgi:hypothetical protein